MLQELGFDIDAKTLDGLVEKFKALADEKKVVTDADLQAGVVIQAFNCTTHPWKLCSLLLSLA
jgi:isopropylmalate/homocitrate/citramalate synthase